MPDETTESRPPHDMDPSSQLLPEATSTTAGQTSPEEPAAAATTIAAKDDLDLSHHLDSTDLAQPHRSLSVPLQPEIVSPPKPIHSFFDTTIDPSTANYSKIDTISEDTVREHLQDVESSFIAPLSPIQTHNPEGVDDTYLFDRTAALQNKQVETAAEDLDGSREMPSSILERAEIVPLSPVVEASDTQELDIIPPHPNLATPPTTKKDTPTFHSGTIESYEPSPSPTAAAHARTVSRALSRGSNSRDFSQSASWQASSSYNNPEQPEELFGLDPSLNKPESSENVTNHQSQPPESTHRNSSDTGNSLSFGKRPKYLKSRNASQRSSASSFASHTDDGDSNATVGLGADYALQTGGAIPAMGISRNLSNILSRSISIGSMASGIEEYEDSRPSRRDDERDITLPTPDEIDSLLETPKPKNSLTAPTDTVIAQHVRNVQVPESLAREYKTQRGLKTPKPGKEREVTFATERKSKHMTLKEQSTTLDRLSKENFDLKLKVVFLNEKLGQLSEEGIKDMVKENVELKTTLAIAQRDNKTLRRRAKQLEKQLREADERPSTSKSVASDDDSDDAEREEELVYLRERIEEYTSEIERLKNDNLSKEVEKRRLADSLKSTGENLGDDTIRQEETDLWKELLEQETARREQVDDENRRLRDEIFRLKQDGLGGLHHTTNIYNITKKNPQTGSPSRPISGHSDMDNGTVSSITLVEELQRDRDRLTHEVAELRREINAQASMLTSRNREKDRLYQEIEDLKLAQRRGGPAPSTVDTILERSASRAGHDRSPSRASGPIISMDDVEREEYENKQAEMRDKINELKLHNQNLQTEIDACVADFETVATEKQELEEHFVALQGELEAAENDLVVLQKERDEALQEQEAIGIEFDKLRQEAQEEIDTLEEQEDRFREEIKSMDSELKEKTEDLNALQHKMREMSETINQIEDKMDQTNRQNEKLRQELTECNQEVEMLEAKLRDANDKTQRLNVQQENYQVEIGFLREEQENHIVKIGNLEASLDAAQQAIHDEKERVKELEHRLASERKQRELVANREKEEVQQYLNELNHEISNSKDESRKLRKMLTSKEVETTQWKERLHELESNLRVALGDLNGTRSSLLKVSFSLYPILIHS